MHHAPVPGSIYCMRISSKQILLLGILCIVVASLVRGIKSYDDTTIYLSALQQIQGKQPVWQESGYILSVIPLLNNVGSIIAGAALGLVTGSELSGLVLFNILAYTASIFIFFAFAQIVFTRSRDQWAAVVLYGTNYVILRYGIGAYMVDMGGWLFFTLTLYLAVRFFWTQEDRWAYAAGFFSMLGLFFKESGGVAIASLAFLILVSPRSWKQRAILLTKSCSFLFINLGYHIIMYFTRGYLYFDRYATVVNSFAAKQGVLRTIKVFGSLFFVGWIPVPLGIMRTWRERLTPEGRRFILLCCALALPVLIQFAYPAYDQRILFMGVPLFAVLATQGLRRLPLSLLGTFLAIYAVTGFFMDDVMIWFSLDAIFKVVGI